jgi:hypothetical protein
MQVQAKPSISACWRTVKMMPVEHIKTVEAESGIGQLLAHHGDLAYSPQIDVTALCP